MLKKYLRVVVIFKVSQNKGPNSDIRDLAAFLANLKVTSLQYPPPNHQKKSI